MCYNHGAEVLQIQGSLILTVVAACVYAKLLLIVGIISNHSRAYSWYV